MCVIKPVAVFCVLLLAACAAGPQSDRVEIQPRKAALEADARPVETNVVAPPSAPPDSAMSAPMAPAEPVEPRPTQAPPVPPPAPAVAAIPASKPVARPSPAPTPAEKPVMAARTARAPAVAEKPAVLASSEPEPSAAPETADTSQGSLRGQLELLAGSGQSLSADEISHAVVYFVPDSGAVAARPGRYRIYTHNKEFEPASLVIPLGSTISFPNQDEILHNVFSVTPRSSFDLGVYGEGKSADYTFTKTGLVLINCNVHQAMQANVLVVDTPFIVSPGDDGRFVFDNLPSGSGKLMVWHPRANVQSQIVNVPAQGRVSVRLVLTKPRVSEHLNKERKSY
jgi:plastocyanin